MRRRKAEQKKQSRERKRQKRLLELERQRERNKTMISYRDQQVVNMEEERETPSTEMTSPTWNAQPTFQCDYMAMDSVFSAPSPMKVDSLTCLV